MPVRQVSPWWRYWVFQNVTVQTTRVFAGSWAAARVVPNRRDWRGCQDLGMEKHLEIVDVGMLSREVLHKILGNVWLFMWLGWLDDWNDFYQMNGCQKTMLDCLFYLRTLALREGESLILTCDRLCQHKGTTIRHHLPGGGGLRGPKLWTSLLFISLENAKGFPVIIIHVVLCFDLGFQ